MWYKAIIFVAGCAVIPWMTGKTILGRENKETSKAWVFGWLLLFGTFEVAALGAYYFGISADRLVCLFGCFILAVFAGGCCFGRLELPFGKAEREKFKGQGRLIAAAFFLIGIQIAVVVILCHVDDDDAFYVGTATTTYFTNSINKYSPYTGELMNYKEFGDYILSPFPIFWGIIARLLKVHPTFLIHTVLPIVLILLAYVSLWLVGKEIFPGNNKKQWVFLIFTVLLNSLGGFSVRSTSSFLLLRIWQGKAVLCNIMIPLYFYFFAAGEREAESREWYLGLWLLALSSCLSSFSGVLILPILVVIYLILQIVERRNWKRIIIIGGTIIPYLILGLFYALRIRR